MARVHLYGSRILPSAVAGWIVNHSTKNYWRVANWYELDDLIGDGLMKAYECLDKYGEPGVDIDPPHFMALVKTSFHRHIAEVLRHSRPDQELVVKVGDVSGETADSDYLDRIAEPVSGVQDFVVLLGRLPAVLQRVIALYLNNPEKLRRKGRAHLEGEPETEAQSLKRLAGFPLRHDFETELRRYLEDDQSDDEPEFVSKLMQSLDLPASLRRLVLKGLQGDSNMDAEAASAIRDLVAT